jgi:dsRNA-specific ribonuclease
MQWMMIFPTVQLQAVLHQSCFDDLKLSNERLEALGDKVFYQLSSFG